MLESALMIWYNVCVTNTGIIFFSFLRGCGLFPMPSQGLMDIDTRIDLIDALNKLTPRQRKVVILWAAGYTQQEIAKEYGVTQQAVSLWIQDATCKMGELWHYVIEDT